MCVQEVGRLVMAEGEKLNFTTFEKKKNDHTKDKGKGQFPANQAITKESSCFFCKKKGHMKKDRVKFKAWLKKNGNFLMLFVMNLIWLVLITIHGWINSGTTIKITISMKFGKRILLINKRFKIKKVVYMFYNYI